MNVACFRTRLTQDAVIKVFGISFKDYCESLIKNTMANNASKVSANLIEGRGGKTALISSSTNKVLFSDTFGRSPPLNCDLPQNLEASVSAVIPRTPYFTNDEHNTDIAVQAVWSQAAGQVDGSPFKATQHGSSCIKSLESVVLSLHNTAKCTPTSQQISTGSPGSTTHYNGLPVLSSDAVLFSGKSHDSASLELTSECRGVNSPSYRNIESPSASHSAATGVPAKTTGSQDFPPRSLSSDEPYPVFLPSFSRSETKVTESSPPEIAKQEVEVTFSSCYVSPLSQNNLELENAIGASPSTPDSWMPGCEVEEAAASSTACVTSKPAANGHSPSHEDLDSTTTNETQKNHDHGTADSAEEKQAVQENAAASSSGNSAFFDFLLTQGSEFNPTMKFQIVELIKCEFGKKMAGFNTEICQTEAEKRNLETEIRNSTLLLQQKEEEKLRLFAEIDKLQKNIVRATEKHKTLSQQSVKLKEESETVKRKISSCEDVEKELFGSPAKMKKVVER